MNIRLEVCHRTRCFLDTAMSAGFSSFRTCFNYNGFNHTTATSLGVSRSTNLTLHFIHFHRIAPFGIVPFRLTCSFELHMLQMGRFDLSMAGIRSARRVLRYSIRHFLQQYALPLLPGTITPPQFLQKSFVVLGLLRYFRLQSGLSQV